MAIPLIEANFTSSLAAKISDTASSLTLTVSTDADGTTFAGQYYLTLDEGTASEEHMIVTLAGTAGTIGTRGLSRVDAVTLKTGNRFEHDRGAVVKMTNIGLIRVLRRLNGTEAFDSVALTGILSIAGLATPTAGETTKAANVDYVNNVALAGAPDSAENVKGVVECADSTEVAAGDDTGTTTAPTVVRPSKLAEVIQKGSYIYAVEDGTGGDDTYTASMTPTPGAYTAGMLVAIKFTVANTGACTINLNSLGAKDIQKYVTGALAALETGDIVANQTCLLYYDGTRFVLINPTATMPTTALLSEMATFFGATDITGAEAETLTTGGSITTLHFHKKTFGAATVANGSAQVIAHGLGITPKRIKITAQQGIGANVLFQSFGIFDGTNYATILSKTDSASDAISTVAVISIATDAIATLTATAALDATNITLTWSSSSTCTAAFLWEAET